MKLIRNGVFETNSSSAHSLSFGTSKVVRGAGWGMPPDETDFSNSLYHLSEVPSHYQGYSLEESLNDYGWTGYDVDTPQQKLSYLLTALGADIQDVRQHPFYTQLEEWLSELGIGFIKAEDCDGYTDGYIDHQSHGIVEPSLFKTKEDLITYLFNDDLIIHIENDNGDYQEWYTGERTHDDY